MEIRIGNSCKCKINLPFFFLIYWTQYFTAQFELGMCSLFQMKSKKCLLNVFKIKNCLKPIYNIQHYNPKYKCDKSVSVLGALKFNFTKA